MAKEAGTFGQKKPAFGQKKPATFGQKDVMFQGTFGQKEHATFGQKCQKSQAPFDTFVQSNKETPKVPRPVYSRVFPCIPVFSVFSVFTCIPVYSRVFPIIPGIPLYSVCSRVFPGIPVYSRDIPVFPGIPVYSRVFPVFPCEARPARPLEPRGPFCGGGGVTGGGVPCGMPRYTPGYAPWAYPGVYTWQTTRYTTPGHPATAQERASGLKGPRGVRVGQGPGAKGPGTLPYLRSFWPGVPDRLQPVRDNRWIGSRSGRPLAGLDVSDLERLR